jgi:predicted transcriptional regulator
MNRKIKVKLEKNGFDAFFRRVEANAKALDRGEDIPDEIVISFEEPSAMFRVMTAERLRLLERLQANGETPVAALASDLGRDKRAVSRDVSTLRDYGLLATRYVSNAGHGRNLLVMPSAKRLELTAAIG